MSGVLIAVVVTVSGAGSVAADPTTETDGDRSLTVSESTDIPAADAAVTVTGSGFDPEIDLYLAICAADIVPADPLTYCLGGAVPDDNSGGAWAVVTSEPDGKANATAYTSGGSFSVDLNIDSASGSTVDCLTEGCLLVARSDGAVDARPADLTIPLTFSEVASETSEPPSTVSPETVGLPEAQIGEQQTVVFAGFEPGEEVAVTVFSEPVELPVVTAGPSGIVTITFVVSDQLTPGQHTVQAIGQESGTVGIASFLVLEPPPPTSESVTSSAVATTTAATTSASPTSTVATTAEDTTSAVAAPPSEPAQGNPLWWLWAAIAMVVLIGSLTLAVALSRRRAQQFEQERLAREEQLAAARGRYPDTAGYDSAATGGYPAHGGHPSQPYADGGGQPGGYSTGSHYPAAYPNQERGLLSGHTGEGPALYSGQGYPGEGYGEPYPPTQPGSPSARGDEPTDAIQHPGDSTQQWSPPPAGEVGEVGERDDPPTQQWSPTSADDDPADPPTQRWSPEPDAENGDGPRR